MTKTRSKLATYSIAIAALSTVTAMPMLGATVAKAEQRHITTFQTKDRDDLISSYSSNIGRSGIVRVCLKNEASDREPKTLVLRAGPTNNLVTIRLNAKFRGSEKCRIAEANAIFRAMFYKSGTLMHSGRFTAKNWNGKEVRWIWRKD